MFWLLKKGVCMPRPRLALPAALLALTALLAPAAPAAEPLVTDRPDFTESAVTVPAGRWQLETGTTLTRAGGADDHALGEVLARIALGDRLELRLGGGSFHAAEGDGGADERGWEDASLGAKLALAPGGGRRPTAALLAAVSVPTGSGAFGGDGVVPEAVLALAWDLAPDLGLGVNAGYARARDPGGRFDQPFASVALGWGAGPRLGAFVEVYGFGREERGGDAAGYADGGVTLLFGPDRQLDLRAGAGLAGAGRGRFAGVGYSLRW
jgi:hypothetical protein